MDEMQALAEEQRKAGLLLDDGAPVKLNVSIAASGAKDKESSTKEKVTVFNEEDDDEDGIKKRKVPLVKLDFSVAESSEQAKERLEKIKLSVPHDKEVLFKAKVRWDGLSDVSNPSRHERLVLTNIASLLLTAKWSLSSNVLWSNILVKWRRMTSSCSFLNT